jgi:sugar/nucleoside kinase (ribokinase family)
MTEEIIKQLQEDASRNPTVTVIGDLNYDYIYESPPLEEGKEVIITGYTRVLAGAAGYVTCGLARLGARVNFITQLGNDSDGEELFGEISERGVNTAGIRFVGNGHTPFTLIFADAGESRPRQVATYNGILNTFSVYNLQYRSFIDRSDAVYSCNYFIMPILREQIGTIFTQAQSRNVLTAYDANAGDGWEDPRQLETLTDHIYPATSVIFLNQEEAKSLAGREINEETLHTISPNTPVVIIKRGGEGLLIRSHGTVLKISAFPLAEPPKDTVGAGDAFQAAFLFFYLKQFPIHICGVLAAANAASTVQYKGGTAGQLNKTTLAEFLENYRIERQSDTIIDIRAKK